MNGSYRTWDCKLHKGHRYTQQHTHNTLHNTLHNTQHNTLHNKRISRITPSITPTTRSNTETTAPCYFIFSLSYLNRKGFTHSSPHSASPPPFPLDAPILYTLPPRKRTLTTPILASLASQLPHSTPPSPFLFPFPLFKSQPTSYTLRYPSRYYPFLTCHPPPFSSGTE